MKKTTIGTNLRYLRKSRNLSQRELAENLGLKRNNVASYEAGIVEPRALTFVRIARYFRISPLALLTEDLAAAAAASPGGPAGAPLPTPHGMLTEFREFYHRKHSDQTPRQREEAERILHELVRLADDPHQRTD